MSRDHSRSAPGGIHVLVGTECLPGCAARKLVVSIQAERREDEIMIGKRQDEQPQK